MPTPNPPHGEPGHVCEIIRELVDVTESTEMIDPEGMLLATITLPIPNGIELSQVGLVLEGIGQLLVKMSGWNPEQPEVTAETDVVTPKMHIASAINLLNLADPLEEQERPYMYEPFTFTTIDAEDVSERPIWYALSAAQIAAEKLADDDERSRS